MLLAGKHSSVLMFEQHYSKDPTVTSPTSVQLGDYVINQPF